MAELKLFETRELERDSSDSDTVTFFMQQLSTVKYSTAFATAPRCLIRPGHSRLSVSQPVVHRPLCDCYRVCAGEDDMV